MPTRRIGSITSLLKSISHDSADWGLHIRPWFRGEPVVDTPLLPGVFRRKADGTYHDENQLVQSFRRQAPSLLPGAYVDRHDVDNWLFLMQHVRLPTRLLDWTEGALIALYFALQFEKPVVWMLNPSALLRLATKNDSIEDNVFFLTWFRPNDQRTNIATENIRAAWEHGNTPFELPAPVHPTYVHTRMNAQISRFTAHGKDTRPMPEILPPDILKRYEIQPSKTKTMFHELHSLGITHTTLFPDLDGLAVELRALY
jgi:hypothetical protein